MGRPTDADLAGLVAPGAVLLVGELHGTHEFPELVARLAGLAVDRGLAAAVALEVPASEQPAFDAFLAGPDDTAARAALTRSDVWHPDPGADDGRAGRGLLRLLRSLHRLAARGRVVVRAVDLPAYPVGAPLPAEAAARLSRRDEVMADGAARAFVDGGVRDRTGVGIVLAGNVHTRVVRRVPFEPPHLGMVLRRSFPDLVALHGHHSGGCCRARVDADGARTVRFAAAPTPAGSVGRTTRWRDVRRTGHHGWVNVGRLTPSSPLPPAPPPPETGRPDTVRPATV